MKIHHYKIGRMHGFYTRGPNSIKKTQYRYFGEQVWVAAWCRDRQKRVRLHPMGLSSLEEAKEVALSRAQRGFRPDLKSNRIEFVRDQIVGGM